MPDEIPKNRLISWLLLLCLVMSCLSTGVVGVIIMSELADIRVEMAAYHDYEVTITESAREQLLDMIDGYCGE